MIDNSLFGETESSAPSEPQYHQADFYPAMKACTACACRAEAMQVVPGIGPLSAEILFLGRNPGRDEDKSGYPFIGRGGNELDRMLMELDIDRQKIGIMNIVKCHTMGDRPPKPIEVTTCTNLWLGKELKLFSKAKIIFPLGKEAVQYMLGHDAVSPGKREGYWVKISDDKGRVFHVCPLNHPGYILRAPRFQNQMYNTTLPAVKKLLQLHHGEVYARARI